MKIIKCRKKLVDKLVEECSESNGEVKITECKSVENIHKCSPCTLYIVLFSIVSTINVGIGTYFVYSHGHLKKEVTHVKFGICTQTTI